MSVKKYSALLFFVLTILFCNNFVYSAEWPTWGANSQRSFSVEGTIPENLQLLWLREFGKPEFAWPFQFEEYFTYGNPSKIGKTAFDLSYEPVAAEGKLFVPSMKADRVTAYLADTGEELWRYYVDGPVRLAPAYSKGKLYFVSDDGYLYCLNANSGALIWKFKGFYSEGRNIIGNERLISMWPARGGPVLADGVVYFAAGILPFEGVFIHAVDAETGKSIWTNSTSGSMWFHHQHPGAWAYGGISPQGYLVVSGDRLIVSGGRTTPAVYNRKTGEFLYYRQENAIIGKGAGGYMVSAWDGWFTNHGMLYSLENGAQYGAVPISVITKDTLIGVDKEALIAHKSQLKRKDVKIKDRLGSKALKTEYTLEQLWTDSIIKEVKRLYFQVGPYLAVNLGGKKAGLVKLGSDGKPEKLVWQYDVEDEIWDMITSEEKLYLITESGKIYCFGAKTNNKSRSYVEGKTPYEPSLEYIKQADNIILRTGVTGGYALCWGAGNNDLVKSLIDKTSLHIMSIENNEKQLNSFRRRFDSSGDYGKRVAFINADPLNIPLPPYMAELIILAEGNSSDKHISKAFYSLRPYSGKIYIENPGRELPDIFKKLNLENGKLTLDEGFAVISREGPLKGAGQWTHQYAGASNRAYSDDELVKPPLGVLWFGGTSNLNALPRHQNGPIPQVSGGRLVILGINTISARCVYTGRELWVKEILGIGHPFTSLEHEELFFNNREVYMPSAPGANFIGSPYVSLPDIIYVIDKEKILLLNPDTGKTKKEFRLPFVEGMKRYEWGHILVWEDLLVATVEPQFFDEALAGDAGNWNATSSTMLLVMNRFNGKVLWAKKAEKIGFRHNAIIAGNGKLFVVDGLSKQLVENLQRRGFEGETESVLISFDIRTGKEVWKKEKDIFGTWLSYYDDRDILIQGGRRGQRVPPVDEPSNRMIAFKGETGEELWEQKYSYAGPVSLHEKMIIPGRPGQKVVDPVTGGFFQVDNPFTGDKYDWSYFKTYGCGTMNSSKYFVMFRSGAAGFNDLYNFGGTGNFGGFKASCTNNLVAADGVFNAPDVTRTCTCAYQLQTSLGMVHNPLTEMWTHNHRLTVGKGTIKSLGINFGAPGNRRENGVLWVEYPTVYAAGPKIGLEFKANKPEWFRHHASWIKNPEDGYAWVASYGIKGIERVGITLVPAGEKEILYDIVLYFAEPEEIGVGERVFDVNIQGEKVLFNFDVIRQAGGERRVVVSRLKNIPVKNKLEISFKATDTSLPPVISGIEIISTQQD